MKEVTIHSIGKNLMNASTAVLLKEKEGQRYLPIWVGPYEANAIRRKLEGIITTRPMSHDVIFNVMGNLGATLDSVQIDGLKDDVFVGEITLNYGDMIINLDARPSDALVLALMAEASVYVDEEVLDVAGVVVREEETASSNDEDISDNGITSPFGDFIETLNLDDIGN